MKGFKTLTILTPINNTMIRIDSDKIRIPGVPVDEQFGNSDVKKECITLTKIERDITVNQWVVMDKLMKSHVKY